MHRTIAKFIFSQKSGSGVDLEEMNVLVGLGLSVIQARVYLALLRAGETRARVIAKLALINRQEVYRLLAELQQLGLVTQNLTTPTTYTSIPLAEATNILYEQKTNELRFISNKVKKINQQFNRNIHISQTDDESKLCFGRVSSGDRGEKYRTAIQETQHTIEVMTNWLRFKKLCFLFETQLLEAIKKGVIIKIITEKSSNSKLPKWVSMALSEYPNITFILSE